MLDYISVFIGRLVAVKAQDDVINMHAGFRSMEHLGNQIIAIIIMGGTLTSYFISRSERCFAVTML